MLAGMTGSFGGILYMWIRYGKPDASMSGNGIPGRSGGHHRAQRIRQPVAAAIIGLVAGVLVCLSCEFVERVLKVDDPVGAISVHGTNGIWGVIAVGLFADGKSNYGGSWNGVAGNVTGLFYGDAGQLVAQLMGVATLSVSSSSSASCSICSSTGLWVIASRRRSNWQVWTFRKWVRSLIRTSFSSPNRRWRISWSPLCRQQLDHRPTSPSVRRGVVAAGSLAGPAHGSAGGAVGVHPALEQACLAEPRSADLRTCLGMAYAMNCDVYKSMDALEEAVALDPAISGRSSSMRSCTTGCACSTARKRRHSRPLDLADQSVAVLDRPETAPGDPRAQAQMRPQRRVDKAADRAGARAVGDAPRRLRGYDVE